MKKLALITALCLLMASPAFAGGGGNVGQKNDGQGGGWSKPSPRSDRNNTGNFTTRAQGSSKDSGCRCSGENGKPGSSRGMTGGDMGY